MRTSSRSASVSILVPRSTESRCAEAADAAHKNTIAALATKRAAGRKNISLTAAAARLAGNEPTGGSFRRRQCRFFGRLGTDSPTAKVRMPSTVMTPGAMLVRGHIRIRCCTLWRRRPLVSRLSHRQILRHCNCRQCADNQAAAYESDIHVRLHVLLQIRQLMATTSVVKMTRTPYPGQGQRQVQ